MPRSVGVLSVLVIFFISGAQSYFITVDAHAEECFFDKVKSGTKMGLMFEVAEGGFLDIDVRIVGPDGKTIHQVKCRQFHMMKYFGAVWHNAVLTQSHIFHISGRKGVQWKIHICCSHGRRLPVLLLQPDVHHDPQDCHVQHGHRRGPQ